MTFGRSLQALLVASTLPLLGGCVDCFDAGELEAAYHEGKQQAAAANLAAFERGRHEASLLTYDDGIADGDADGYEAGYLDGYHGPFGYAKGYEAGYLDGNHEAAAFDSVACTAGVSDGYADGEYDGYQVGWSDGYTAGFDDGYADGTLDGESSCALALARIERDEQQICRERGHDHNLDPTAFERGYEAGKRDNHDYMAGYVAQYELAHANGISDGELDGFDQGYTAGFDAGYVDGYDAAYFECYDPAYSDGYAAGHESGWYEGIAVGYDEGYVAGFHDASGEC